MGPELDAKTIGEITEAVAEKKFAKAAGVLAGWLVGGAAAMAGMGPGAIAAGAVTKKMVEALADRLASDPNTERMLAAGRSYDEQREFIRSIALAVVTDLTAGLKAQGNASDDLAEAHFHQLIKFLSRNVVDVLQAGQQRILDAIQGSGPRSPVSSAPPFFEGPGRVPAREVPYFTGRETEMAELTRLLTTDDSRALCIVAVGLGGVGKTALAQQFVAKEAPRLFPDGAAWLDATQLSSELPRVARRFEWPQSQEPTVEQARDYLCRVLEGRPILLVLDNVPEAATSEVLGLLPIVGGQSRTLVTSRHRTLHLDLPAGAKCLDLDRWSLESAREFLRAFSGRCSRLDDPELDGLSGFVGRLPLGVRLVAKLFEHRLSLQVHDVLTQVARRPLQELDGVAGGADKEVAQTFRDVYSILSEDERRILLALSACAQGTRDWIVSEVSGVALDATKRALDGLFDWSLVEGSAESEVVWGLHDVVRLFTQAQPGHRDLVEEHVRWVREHCKRYEKPEQHELFAQGADEVATAVRRLVADGRYGEAHQAYLPLYKHLMQVGRFGVAVELGECLLKVVAEGSSHQAKLLGNLGLCYRTLGDIPRAVALHQRSLAIYEQFGELGEQAQQLGYLGLCHRLGEIPKAIELHQRALAIDEQLDNLEGQARQLSGLGFCYQTLGDIPKAIELHQRALAISEKLGWFEGQARQLNGLGLCYRTLGDIPKAIELHQRALALNVELGRLEGQASALGNLGLCYKALGETPKAIELHQRSLVINQGLEILEGQAIDLGNLGLCYKALGETPKAIEFLDRSLALNEKLGNLDGQAIQLGNLGTCYEATVDTPKAVAFHQRSLAIFEEVGDLHGQGSQHWNLGLSHRTLGDMPKAIEYLERALSISERLGSLGDAAEALRTLGLCYQALSETPKAIEYLERALNIFERLGSLENAADALGNLGLWYQLLGQTPKAIQHLERSLDIEEKIGNLEAQAADLGNLGGCYHSLDQTLKAIDLFERSLALSEEIGSLERQAMQLGNLGACYDALGDNRIAIQFNLRSLDIEEKLGRLEGQAERLGNLGLSYQALNDIPKAIQFHQRSLTLNEKLGSLEGQADQLANLGTCYRNFGETSKAIDFLERSLALNEKLGNLDGQAIQLGRLGLCYRRLKNIRKARECLVGALSLYSKIGVAATHPDREVFQRALTNLG